MTKPQKFSRDAVSVATRETVPAVRIRHSINWIHKACIVDATRWVGASVSGGADGAQAAGKVGGVEDEDEDGDEGADESSLDERRKAEEMVDDDRKGTGGMSTDWRRAGVEERERVRGWGERYGEVGRWGGYWYLCVSGRRSRGETKDVVRKQEEFVMEKEARRKGRGRGRGREG